MENWRKNEYHERLHLHSEISATVYVFRKCDHRRLQMS